MKGRYQAIIKFAAAALILIMVAFWVTKTNQPFNLLAYSVVGVMVVVAGFAFYQGIVALKNERQGLRANDELSRRIQEKAAATAFKLSIYMWLFGLLFLLDFVPVQSVAQAKIIVAVGMMGMALIFLFCRLYFSKVGIDNENEN